MPISSRGTLALRSSARAASAITSRTLALLLALSSLPLASTHAAEPPPAKPPPLRTTVAPTIDDAALLPQWLDDRNRDLSQALALPGHTQWIAVQIDGATYDYRVTVTPFRDGAPSGPPATTLTCECNTEALLTMIDREIDGAVERLRAGPADEPAPAAPTEIRSPTPASAPAPRRAPAPILPRQWRFSSLGIAGVATGALGLLTIGAGTSFVAAGKRPIPGWSKLDRDYRPLGYTTLATGIAVLSAGVVMAVIDGVRLRREHRSLARRMPQINAIRFAAQPMVAPLLPGSATRTVLNEKR